MGTANVEFSKVRQSKRRKTRSRAVITLKQPFVLSLYQRAVVSERPARRQLRVRGELHRSVYGRSYCGEPDGAGGAVIGENSVIQPVKLNGDPVA